MKSTEYTTYEPSRDDLLTTTSHPHCVSLHCSSFPTRQGSRSFCINLTSDDIPIIEKLLDALKLLPSADLAQ